MWYPFALLGVLFDVMCQKEEHESSKRALYGALAGAFLSTACFIPAYHISGDLKSVGDLKYVLGGFGLIFLAQFIVCLIFYSKWKDKEKKLKGDD